MISASGSFEDFLEGFKRRHPKDFGLDSTASVAVKAPMVKEAVKQPVCSPFPFQPMRSWKMLRSGTGRNSWILTSRTSIGNEMLKTLHLSQVQEGLLADLILGHEPVCAVEWDPYCCQVPRERASEGWFPGLQVWEGDVRLFPASEWKGRVDCISGGFPCQPHSVAGKRKGHLDDRNLWPEVVRVVREIQPEWVFLENVPGIISNRFIETVLGDLAVLGYDCRWTLLGADQVGAPHKRERWWLLAHPRASDCEGGATSRQNDGGDFTE